MTDSKRRPGRRVGFDPGDVDDLLATGGGLLGELTNRDDAPAQGEEIDRWLNVRTGPYCISEFIDRGGMSLVFRAERSDGQFEQQVAIKILQSASGSELNQRFERERQLLARLEHPGIARIIDSGSTDGQAWIAMELIDGVPIDQHCDQRRLTLQQRLTLFARVASAVQFAHGRLVVHRDLKPSNILVDAEGRPKLLDFGIAKALEDDTGGATLTGSALLLTPMYASPEQVLGAPVGVASDVYQLGLVLHRLLTGRNAQPLDSASVAQIKSVVVDTDPTSPSTQVVTTGRQDADWAQRIATARSTSTARLSKLLNGDLDAIVLRALEKTPSDRYQTVQQLIDDIENYLAKRPVAAQRQTGWYRAKRFIQRHRRGVVASVLMGSVVLASLASVVLSSKRTVVAQRAAMAEAEASQEVGQFITQLLASADPGLSVGDELTVVELLDQAALDLEGELDSQPETKIALATTIGEAYLKLGKYERAGHQFTLANKVALGQQWSLPRRAQNRLRWASCLVELDRYDEARAVLEELSPVADSDGAVAAKAQLIRADIALSENHPDVALSNAEAALQRLDDDSDHELRIEALQMVGFAARTLREWPRAEAALTEVSDLAADHYGQEHYRTALALINLANYHTMSGDYDAAEGLLSNSIDKLVMTLGEFHPHTGKAYMSLGILRYYREDYDQAASASIRARDIFARVSGQNSSLVASVSNNIGTALMEAERYPESIAEFERAIAIRTTLTNANHISLESPLHNLIRVRWELGEFEAALPFADRLLSMMEANPESLSKLDMARNYVLASRVHRELDDDRRASELLERADQGFAESDSAPPGERLLALVDLAMVNERLGRTESAALYAQRAQRFAQEQELTINLDNPLLMNEPTKLFD